MLDSIFLNLMKLLIDETFYKIAIFELWYQRELNFRHLDFEVSFYLIPEICKRIYYRQSFIIFFISKITGKIFLGQDTTKKRYQNTTNFKSIFAIL